MASLHFYHFHVTSLPVHHVRSCVCQQITKSQVQMKTKASETAMKAEGNTFVLTACIWLLFPLLNALSWSKQLIIPLYHMFFCGCRRSIDHPQLTKWKIEPAMISFMQNTTSTKMADQTDDSTVTKGCKSFSIFFQFQMDDKWSERLSLIFLSHHGLQQIWIPGAIIVNLRSLPELPWPS